MGSTRMTIETDLYKNNSGGNYVKNQYRNMPGVRPDNISRDLNYPKINGINIEPIGRDIKELWGISKKIKGGELDPKDMKKASELLEKLKIKPEDLSKVLDEASKLERSGKGGTFKICYGPGANGEKSVYLKKDPVEYPKGSPENPIVLKELVIVGHKTETPMPSLKREEENKTSFIGSFNYSDFKISNWKLYSLKSAESPMFSQKSMAGEFDLLKSLNPSPYDKLFRNLGALSKAEQEKKAAEAVAEEKDDKKSSEKKRLKKRYAKLLAEVKREMKILDIKDEEELAAVRHEDMLAQMNKIKKEYYLPIAA